MNPYYANFFSCHACNDFKVPLLVLTMTSVDAFVFGQFQKFSFRDVSTFLDDENPISNI